MRGGGGEEGRRRRGGAEERRRNDGPHLISGLGSGLRAVNSQSKATKEEEDTWGGSRIRRVSRTSRISRIYRNSRIKD